MEYLANFGKRVGIEDNKKLKVYYITGFEDNCIKTISYNKISQEKNTKVLFDFIDYNNRLIKYIYHFSYYNAQSDISQVSLFYIS